MTLWKTREMQSRQRFITPQHKIHTISFVPKASTRDASGNKLKPTELCKTTGKVSTRYITDVLNAIRPIYDDLSRDELLYRCRGGFTQNANESLNNVIWGVAPKTTNSSGRVVGIASYIAVCLFNEEVTALLKSMRTMSIIVGRNATQYAYRDRRATQATIRAQHAGGKNRKTHAN